MNKPREQIYAALFAALQGAAPFSTASRRLRLWGDVAPADQPALFQMQAGEAAHTDFPGAPLKWSAKVEAFVYCRSDAAEATIPATTINGLLDAIEAALAPATPGDAQTLGGLVTHCWIDGEVKVDEGVLDQQAIAVVPISILVIA